MYGMIHRGIRQMTIDRAGVDAWRLVEERLGIGPAELISANVYPDELTLALIAAAAEQMGHSVPECLNAFGRYWIGFAENSPYGAIMDFVGQDIAEFVTNLDRMHKAVLLAMPEAQVPDFTLLRASPGELVVRYRGKRAGLEVFVIGLLEGLLERFGRTGRVTLANSSADAADFIVALDPLPA